MQENVLNCTYFILAIPLSKVFGVLIHQIQQALLYKSNKQAFIEHPSVCIAGEKETRKLDTERGHKIRGGKGDEELCSIRQCLWRVKCMMSVSRYYIKLDFQYRQTNLKMIYFVYICTL